MHPSSLLSYYPTYNILDNIVNRGNYSKINLFIDLKNNLQTVYQEHAVKTIAENSYKSKYLDTSVFSSILPFLVFHKLYAIKRQFDINFYIFFEVGRSYFHTNINKKYKISRKIDDLYGLDQERRQKFTEALQANFSLVDKALNYVPNVYVFRLENLEADFIPYFLVSRDLINKTEDTCNIVYSNDHDLYQCCMKDTFVFSKSGRDNRKVISENEIMETFCKQECDIEDEYLPLAMAIIGDAGDDVEGIKGIGHKTFLKIFPDIKKLVGSMEEVYENLEKGNNIFGDINQIEPNKKIEEIVKAEEENSTISKNLKQVSFEYLSRKVEKPYNTEMANRRDQIYRILNEKKIASKDSLKEALNMNGVYFQDELEVLYYEPEENSENF